MGPETPDKQHDDGTEQVPEVLECRSSDAWHPVFLVTEDEIPNRKLD